MAVLRADHEPLLLLLLLDIFLPLPLFDGEIAGEAVIADESTARVGFHLEAISSAPEPAAEPAADPEADSDPGSELEPEPDPEPPPRPLRMAPAIPVTESVPTCCPENTIAVVTAAAVNVAVEASSADGECLADS